MNYLCVVHVSKVSWDCEVHRHGRPQGGGGNSKRSPLLEKIVSLYGGGGGLFAIFYLCAWGSFLLGFSPYGAFSSCGGILATFS